MLKLKGRRLEFFRENDLHFASQGMPAAKKVQKDDAQPYRPVDLRKSQWVLGDVTEVLDHNSWRLGKIAKVLKNGYFIIRLTGCIQLREYHVSCLRVPNAYRSKQLPAVHRDREAYEEDGHATNRHKTINLCSSTGARNLKKKPEPSRMPPDDLIRGTGKKRKATAYKVHHSTKELLPLKVDTVSTRNDIDGDCLYRHFSDRYNDLAKNNITKRKSYSKVLPSSQIHLQVIEENECSVASCSVNYLEYSINDNQQSVELSSCFPDDAMSTCPSAPRLENNNNFAADLATDVHELELQAYQSTVRALYASRPLT